jgi:geranylgeranyl pyrophosphate synthase
MQKSSLDGTMEEKTATFFDLTRDNLVHVEQRMRSSSSDHHPGLHASIDHLLSSGGKRIRPTMVLLIGEMLDGDLDRLTTLAASIEMLHTATLVHDDLIDGSMLRRGIPTLNAKWSSGATVLTGDYIFARAADLAAKTGSLPLMERFAETLMTIVNGEITQMFDASDTNLREAYLNRIYAKTASLFQVAAEGAALVSGTDESTKYAMKAFGNNVGLAFQIVDDVLDFTGDEREVGKPVGNDLRQGIITLPTIYYLDENGRPELEMRFRQLDLPKRDMEEVISEIRSSPAISRAMAEAQSYITKAISDLQGMPEGRAQSALIELAQYVIHRTV